MLLRRERRREELERQCAVSLHRLSKATGRSGPSETKGIGVGKNRVLRLMRENGLLAPVRRGKHPRGDRSHSGRITTDVPNELWGTDATRFYTKEDGWCWFFVAVDHCVTDVWHVAKKGDLGSARADPPGCTNPHRLAPKIALGLGLGTTGALSAHVPRRAGLARDARRPRT